MTPIFRTILLTSLALNLALGVGLFWLAFKPAPPPADVHAREPRGMFHPEALRRSLPQERRELIDSVLATHREAMHTRIGHMKQAREGVREAMQTEPFARERLDGAFARLRETETLTAQEAHALLISLAAQLGPEDRKRLAALLGNRHHGQRHGENRNENRSENREEGRSQRRERGQ